MITISGSNAYKGRGFPMGEDGIIRKLRFDGCVCGPWGSDPRAAA